MNEWVNEKIDSYICMYVNIKENKTKNPISKIKKEIGWK